MLFKSLAVAAALSLGTLAAVPAQAGHRHHHHHGHAAGVGLFGFAAGTMVGAALAQPRPAPRVVYTSDWVAYCFAKYDSYNPATNLYLGFDGHYHQCR
jgi:hypothetical protein